MKSIRLTPEAKKIAAKPAKLPSHLGFGEVFAPLMLTMRYKDGEWDSPRIEPYKSLSLDPACAVLHYSQQVFEGLKAHYLSTGEVSLFRPDRYAARFNQSADRMGVPQIDEDLMVQMILDFTRSVKGWVPKKEGASLYLRPLLFGTDNFLGLRKSLSYIFILMASPVGSYFHGGIQPIRVWVEREYVRAVIGGTGSAKTGGNYAAALKASVLAKEKGFDQVLWLDAKQMKWVEELGGMNVFFKIDGTLLTSPLTGSILPGVTRGSIIELAKKLKIKVKEQLFSVDELLKAVKSGSCTEGFACGTAAVITPIGTLVDGGKEYSIAGGRAGETTMRLYDTLTGIQYGKIAAPGPWLYKI